ncbi:MAG: ABC transporter ATP-binding protein [Chloroflexi bacterium]|jgi:ABC-2 type transport system ATP-binding protein|nr:ABC transporter ATP-binding protein [Chloroflexota bacterium]MBT3670099.1 ABC transporter ATP-binding protein [Chloroflexota bacterium]MBT4001735.1 ABC transporter ATP-binding protein [Chloroflexota bacterium]MBT4306699.1 ABC transporter ATP-binding protein [Chloroflexota bacterium]MBT4532985.1 ABC transporter ATP-binding protein [Chloroflexota bacterium]
MKEHLAIEAKNLDKDFGDVHAVKDVSFEIEKGEIFSLLGPNGAGKSTTISMLSGLLRADSGDASIMGHSIRNEAAQAKAAIGVVPQDIALYEDLSARENLVFWGKMYDLSGKALNQRVDEILDIVGLADRQKHRIDTYSGGMKRRINIGVALLHKPAVVIMDEPTVGIDPQSRRNILDSVKELNAAGMTVLYTTHYMEEAQELSDHLAIMDHGKIIASGTHNELVQIVGELDKIELTVNQNGSNLIDAWKKLAGITEITSENGSITLLVKDSNKVLPSIFETANQMDSRITSVEIFEPNLETVFLHLTGRALRD